MELSSTVMGDELCVISNTLKEASRLLTGGNEKILTQPYRVTCYLWASTLPSKTKCECGGLNLPGGSPPLTAEDESCIGNQNPC